MRCLLLEAILGADPTGGQEAVFVNPGTLPIQVLASRRKGNDKSRPELSEGVMGIEATLKNSTRICGPETNSDYLRRRPRGGHRLRQADERNVHRPTVPCELCQPHRIASPEATLSGLQSRSVERPSRSSPHSFVKTSFHSSSAMRTLTWTPIVRQSEALVKV